MSLCKKCNCEFTPQRGLVNYCSLQCRNSREWSEEDRLKKSIAAKSSEKAIKANKIYKGGNSEKCKQTWKLKLFERPFETLSHARIRRLIVEEQNNKCFDCGIDKWLGQNITLELEHIDGNRFNNKRENVKAICPNCHSLTSTWRGRSCNKVGKFDEEKFLKLYKTEKNLSAVFIKLGMAPKGNNYKTAYKILEKNKIKI